jgi:formylglycine-generating enzyme required for sulfatase activity
MMIALSYRREDSLPIAGRLYDRLQAEFGKGNVFMDFDAIPPGVDFREHIKHRIEESKVVIAVIGPKWVGWEGGGRRIDEPTDFVRLEIGYALQLGIPVIPILVYNMLMPKAERLPADIQALAFRNALSLDSGIDFHNHADRLITSIRRTLNIAPPEEPDPNRSSAPSIPVVGIRQRPHNSIEVAWRLALLTGLVLLLASGAATGWWFWVEQPKRDREATAQSELATRTATERIVTQEAQKKRLQDEAEAKEAARVANEQHLAGQVAAAKTEQQAAEGKKEEKSGKSVIVTATKDQPWENSLGMRFVPVAGTKVLFSIWDTRVRDFRAYVQATMQATGYLLSGISVMKVVKAENAGYTWKWELDKNASWGQPGFPESEEHPVVGVSWDEAWTFCSWLTQKERKEGKIGSGQEYRLPMDDEWTAAVGENKYPWGDEWPPPKNAGNYLDERAAAKLGGPKDRWRHFPWDDGYAVTSPVGTFMPNRFGLYDMGGNVFQWCEEWYRREMNPESVLKLNPELKNDGGGRRYRVLRGSAWHNCDPDDLISSNHWRGNTGARATDIGFRCVLTTESSR